MKEIKERTLLTARSICDHECIFTLEVISRTAKTAKIKYLGRERRAKIRSDREGEFIRPDNYSMSPIFRAR